MAGSRNFCNFVVLLDWGIMRLFLGKTSGVRFPDALSDCWIAVVFLFYTHGGRETPCADAQGTVIGKDTEAALNAPRMDERHRR